MCESLSIYSVNLSLISIFIYHLFQIIVVKGYTLKTENFLKILKIFKTQKVSHAAFAFVQAVSPSSYNWCDTSTFRNEHHMKPGCWMIRIIVTNENVQDTAKLEASRVLIT